MGSSISLSTQQVADILHVSKSTIYDLIRRGEITSYKIGRKVRFTQDDVDRYIKKSHDIQIKKPNLSDEKAGLSISGEDRDDFIISGQDMILDILSSYMRQSGINATRKYLSGFEGLLCLYQKKVNIASCHLFSGYENEYNIPYVRNLMPGVKAVIVNLAYRYQGFYVKEGNPKNILSFEDLNRKDISITNRALGSASRVLLDEKIKNLDINPGDIKGYDNIKNSHLAMAESIASGEADLALGTERVSIRTPGIEFIPLVRERYDLVFRKEDMNSPEIQKLLTVLGSDGFKKELSAVAGNDYEDLGKVMAEV